MTADVIAAWLQGSPYSLTLWPVWWPERLGELRPPGADASWVAPADDELRPLWTAAPWVIEGVVVRRPRPPRWMIPALLILAEGLPPHG